MVENKQSKPLNLKTLFGERYKIELDEAAHCEPGGKKDPWYFQIPCKYGHIYPHSGDRFGFFCDNTRVFKRLLRKHPEVEVSQEGDLEAIFLFPLSLFDAMAAFAQPRKRRRLDSDHPLVEKRCATVF